MLTLPAVFWTLFPMAIALWNRLVFTSSMEKTSGSLSLLVQEIVHGPADVRLLGTEKSMAKARGRKKIITLFSGWLGRTVQMERGYVTRWRGALCVKERNIKVTVKLSKRKEKSVRKP